MDRAIQTPQATQDAPAEEKVLPSLEDISAAWDAEHAESVTEDQEKPEEKKEQEDVPPEPEQKEEPKEPDEDLSHGEKSRLGRKLKKLLEADKSKDATIKELLSKVDNLSGQIQALTTVGAKPEEPVDPDALITRKDLQEILNREKEEIRQGNAVQEKEREQYQEAYVSDLLKHFEADDMEDIAELQGEQAELYAMLTGETEFNQTHTGNPSVDFKINRLNAELHLFKNKKDAKKPNLKQEVAKGTGVGGESKETQKTEKTIDLNSLDPKSREFLLDIKRRGGDPTALAQKVLSSR